MLDSSDAIGAPRELFAGMEGRTTMPTTPRFLTTTAAGMLALAGLLGTVAPGALARVDPPAPTQPQQEFNYTYHWAVTGRYEPSVDLSGVPIQRDVVVLYEHQFGLYPRFYGGRAEHGGIPQNTDMTAHLNKVRADIEYFIPDPNWSGYAIIDYEQWTFIWERFYVPVETYQASLAWTRQRHPTLVGPALEAQAKIDFETAAQRFLLETIRLCKQLRPNAKWGKYMAPFIGLQPHEARMRPLYDEMTAFFPHGYCDFYSIPSGTPGPGQKLASEFEAYLRGNIEYARHVAGDRPVVPFAWLRYADVNRLYGFQTINPVDLEMVLRVPYEAGADGVLFWDYIPREADRDQYNQIANVLRVEMPAMLNRLRPAPVTPPSPGTPQPPQPATPPGDPPPAPVAGGSPPVVEPPPPDEGAPQTFTRSRAQASRERDAARDERPNGRSSREDEASSPPEESRGRRPRN